MDNSKNNFDFAMKVAKITSLVCLARMQDFWEVRMFVIDNIDVLTSTLDILIDDLSRLQDSRIIQKLQTLESKYFITDDPIHAMAIGKSFLDSLSYTKRDLEAHFHGVLNEHDLVKNINEMERWFSQENFPYDFIWTFGFLLTEINKGLVL